MIITAVNRTDADTVKIVVKNVDGSGSITTGMAVGLVNTGASIDGVQAVKGSGANARGFCGIAAQDIPINGVGLVTVWGLANSVLISNVGTSITVTQGDMLIPGAAAGTLFSTITDAAMSTLFYKYVYAASSTTLSAAAYVKGIVRAF